MASNLLAMASSLLAGLWSHWSGKHGAVAYSQLLRLRALRIRAYLTSKTRKRRVLGPSPPTETGRHRGESEKTGPLRSFSQTRAVWNCFIYAYMLTPPGTTLNHVGSPMAVPNRSGLGLGWTTGAGFGPNGSLVRTKAGARFFADSKTSEGPAGVEKG